ncbi:MAG: hypothetical protein JWQ63_2621 [Mucilaginibacter sp.]|nr:hypothetical protein [Mucilaginibacter sp.]
MNLIIVRMLVQRKLFELRFIGFNDVRILNGSLKQG